MELRTVKVFRNDILLKDADPRDVMNVGSPQQIIEKILYQYELFGHQRYIAQMDFGGVSFQKLMKNIELIGN